MTRTASALLFCLSLLVPPSRAEGPVIVEVWSRSCAPCEAMRPEVEALRRAKYPVQALEAEENRATVERYHVAALPTFLVVDDDGNLLGRAEGYRPAAEIAALYNGAVNGLNAAANPDPSRTVVRLRVDDPGSGRVAQGSGVVIDSDDREATVLTAAHLFRVEGGHQYAPGDFPGTIAVDLFDGADRVGTVPGRVVDHDFATDVALVRVRPGRQLPHSPVVPTRWSPLPRMQMTAMGCSQGRCPTPLATTVLAVSAAGPSPAYVGLECTTAPARGRSGGALFTSDGYVAGVCNYASAPGTGLYAAPGPIRRLLDRNRLAAAYGRR